MRIEEPRDLKKPNTLAPSKNLLQFLVADYYLLVLGILEVVSLDVRPDDLERLCPGQLRRASDKLP